uniref:Leukocyte surface antigen CD47 n=1 Tax=Pavo cristatus TaxID=9049 RepID=A0A8C9G1A8_PAVCR
MCPFSFCFTGSTQLVFNAVEFVEKYACNVTVVLPCIVTNLKENNDSSMHVSWKREGQVIFSFNGPEHCEVTELNREGETKMKLRTLMGESSVVFFHDLLGCETVRKKKKNITIACSIFTVVAVVAVVLFIQDGGISMNQIGLAFTVLPTGMLMVLQYSIFKMILDDLTHKGYALLGFQVVGYIVAVVGFALSVSACPSLLLSVIIAGLVVMAVADLLALAYVYSCNMRQVF